MTTPKLIDLRCSNCGAELPPRPSGSAFQCQFCGHAFVVNEPARPPPSPEPPVRIVIQQVRVPVAVRRAPTAFAFLPLLFVGLGIFIATRQMRRTGALNSAVGSLTTAVGSVAGTAFIWDATIGPPVGADVNHDGTEDVLGRYRVSSESDSLYIGAFDGRDLHKLWSMGPLGSYGEGGKSTLFAVAGGRVLVSDKRSLVHELDLASGKEVTSFKMSDLAKQMCAAPQGGPEVFIHVADGHDLEVDFPAGAPKPGKRPAWCEETSVRSCRSGTFAGMKSATCWRGENLAAARGFALDHALTDGASTVASGTKSPGTSLPMAVGYDAARKVKWLEPIAPGDPSSVHDSRVEFDDLANGRYVTPYELSSGAYRLTALDARSGARQWDVAIPSGLGIQSPQALALTNTRVYVATAVGLVVFDASHGAVIGTLGR